MAEPGQILKFQTQKPLSEKIKKKIQSSDWLRDFQTFSKYFQFNIEVYGNSIYTHGI